MNKSLTDKTLSGVNWSFLNTYSNAIITTIIGILLARLLLPKDFGLIGMVVIFTGLADLFSTLGMGKSIIRVKNLSEDHITTATTVTMCSSILIYLVFYFSSPAMGEFYHEARLVPILRVLSIIFVLKGINTVSYAQITKDLDFKTIMIINLSTSIIYGIVSAALAILGQGVWSLVYGKIASQSLAVIMSIYKFPVKLKPVIKRKEFKELAGFGGGISLSNILFYGSSNIDYLLIGRFMNPIALGLYTRAFNLVSNTMDQITGGIYNVLFPAFAAVQDEKERLRRAYLRTVKTVSFILFPILFIIIIDGDYIVKGLYGSKWTGAIASLKILAIAGLFRVSLKYSGAVAHATGRVYAETLRQVIYFIVLGICAYYLIRFNIEGVAWAVVIARFVMFVTLSHLALQIVESSWKEFLKAHIPGIANSIVVIPVNLLLIYVFENLAGLKINEIKLAIFVIINVPIFISAIVFMPSAVKGDTFDWLIEKYSKFIPKKFVKFYLSFNK
jgi:O-antigen/teichoic acid export membrane protein